MKRFYAVALAALCPFVWAEEEQGWKGKGEAGLVIVSGNSESEVLNVGLEFSKTAGIWEHLTKLSAVRAESEGVDNAESFAAEWESKFSFSERTYGFGNIRYFDDKFDSYEGITTAGAGVGYRVLMDEDIKWELSAGLGYRTTELEVTGEDQSGATFLGGSKYLHKLTQTTSISNDTRVESTSDNTFVQNKFAVSVAINSALALKVAYDVRYNSDVAPGDDDTDTITSVNLVYNF